MTFRHWGEGRANLGFLKRREMHEVSLLITLSVYADEPSRTQCRESEHEQSTTISPS